MQCYRKSFASECEKKALEKSGAFLYIIGLKDFMERDRMLDWLLVSQEFGEKHIRLPKPPKGYYWRPFGGGYRWSGAHTCRLWNDAFGRIR